MKGSSMGKCKSEENDEEGLYLKRERILLIYKTLICGHK